MEENKQGGKRVNSGRKPLSDPKKPVTLYVPKSKILLNGGDEKLKLKIYDVISKDFALTPITSNTINSSFQNIPPVTEVQKSVEAWVAEKREIENPELYQDFIDRLNKSKLTEKQKSLVKYA